MALVNIDRAGTPGETLCAFATSIGTGTSAPILASHVCARVLRTASLQVGFHGAVPGLARKHLRAIPSQVTAGAPHRTAQRILHAAPGTVHIELALFFRAEHELGLRVETNFGTSFTQPGFRTLARGSGLDNRRFAVFSLVIFIASARATAGDSSNSAVLWAAINGATSS